MKAHLACLILACLTACVSQPIPPSPPAPTPAPPSRVATYSIKEYDSAGRVINQWRTSRYTETDFPRTVTFTTEGRTITLRGSYQVNEVLLP